MLDDERFESGWYIRDAHAGQGIRQWVRWTSRPLTPDNNVRIMWLRFGPKIGHAPPDAPADVLNAAFGIGGVGS